MRCCIYSGVRPGRAEVATACSWLREGLLFCVAKAEAWSGPDEESTAIHDPSLAPYQAEQYQGGDNISPVCDPPDDKMCTRAVLCGMYPDIEKTTSILRDQRRALEQKEAMPANVDQNVPVIHAPFRYQTGVMGIADKSFGLGNLLIFQVRGLRI
ncbi:hypothetical protein RJ639_045569 [Escallonia herrerae]|uniref:Uncharacterized protein n=1 Tax=Escallonia herrerae TaxID=1293975 RepID=A0AA88W5J6_9ASTE|nr:hypothetical protein RJ639_045569 [Escallonia herrerae]